jgi:hypothetical protein
VAEGGRIEPGAHARDPLRHAEHDAITDQAAQLLYEYAAYMPDQVMELPTAVWVRRAAAILREVARG